MANIPRIIRVRNANSEIASKLIVEGSLTLRDLELIYGVYGLNPESSRKIFGTEGRPKIFEMETNVKISKDYTKEGVRVIGEVKI